MASRKQLKSTYAGTLTTTETRGRPEFSCQLLRRGDGVKVKHMETHQRNPRAGPEHTSIVAPRRPGEGSVKTPF